MKTDVRIEYIDGQTQKPRVYRAAFFVWPLDTIVISDEPGTFKVTIDICWEWSDVRMGLRSLWKWVLGYFSGKSAEIVDSPVKLLPCGHSYDHLILDFNEPSWYAYCYACNHKNDSV